MRYYTEKLTLLLALICTIQEGDDLSAGTGQIGAEMHCIRSVGDAFLRSPENSVVEIVAGLHVREEVRRGGAVLYSNGI